jgi:enamine deaminase RidA (YjgF/YER057c/UK114 family)
VVHGVSNESRFGVSQAIVAGGFAYIAGQIAREPDGTPARTSGLLDQVDRAVSNLDLLLSRIGCSRADVVWVEHHVVGPPEFVAASHARWFSPEATAGMLIPIDSLYDPSYAVEITTIASVDLPAVTRQVVSGGPDEPFARAVRVGGQIFVSGQHGLRAAGADAHLGVGDQFSNAIDRVLECVRELGGGPDDVVSTHIYTARELTAPEIGAVADAHRLRFTGVNRPTANLIGVRQLFPSTALVEVCAMAVIDPTTHNPSAKE